MVWIFKNQGPLQTEPHLCSTVMRGWRKPLRRPAVLKTQQCPAPSWVGLFSFMQVHDTHYFSRSQFEISHICKLFTCTLDGVI